MLDKKRTHVDVLEASYVQMGQRRRATITTNGVLTSNICPSARGMRSAERGQNIQRL